MTISHTKLKEISQPWGFDVIVRFDDNNPIRTTVETFPFASQEDIAANFDNKMVKIKADKEDKKTRDKASQEVISDIDNWYKTNTSMTKSRYETIKNEKVSNLG